MFKLFNKDKDSEIGRPLSKSTVLKLMFNDSTSDLYELKKATIVFKQVPLKLVFINSNYSDKDELSLNGSFMLVNKQTESDQLFWEDLFTIGKKYYGKKYTGLKIKKTGQSWEGSSLQREYLNFIRPLLEQIGSPELFEIISKGEPFILGSKEVALRPAPR